MCLFILKKEMMQVASPEGIVKRRPFYTAVLFIVITFAHSIKGHCEGVCFQYKEQEYHGFYDTRIVGGENAQAHAFPWVALLVGPENVPVCGGSVISDRYVLTAAHCLLLGYPQKQLKILVGAYDRCNLDSDSVLFSIIKLLPHPSFNSVTFVNDIMLIKTNMKITFNYAVQPICIPHWRKESFSSILCPGREGTVLGWGVQHFHAPNRSCVLKKVAVPLLSRKRCLMESNYKTDQVTTTHFCAGFPQGGKDACQGDSGGPLLIQNDEGKYELLGIVSNGISCGLARYPGIYTDVRKFVPWIIVNTMDSCFCK